MENEDKIMTVLPVMQHFYYIRSYNDTIATGESAETFNCEDHIYGEIHLRISSGQF